MESENKKLPEGVALNMATINAAKQRLDWVRSNWPVAQGTEAWRIVMEFDQFGELLKYWESSLNSAGNELFGGGICKDTKPLRLSDVQIDVLLLGAHQKLDRSSMGWSYDARVNRSDPVRIYSQATIKALWTRGLLVGNFNDTRGVGNLGDLVGLQNLDGAVHEHCVSTPKTPKFQVWTSALGKEVLRDFGLISDDTEVMH